MGDPFLSATAMDAGKILVGWDRSRIRALLSRPILDDAIYGAVRFHHRSVREFLTAKWLLRLLVSEKSRRAVEGLFFVRRYGRSVCVPSMRPVLAWLLLWDDRIREKTIRICPEVLIQGGDPSQLPISVREMMLTSLCEHYAKKEVIYVSLDWSDVKRFADPELGSVVRMLYSKYSDHPEIRSLLFKVVWLGKISECSDLIYEYARVNRSYSSALSYAIKSIGSACSVQKQGELLDWYLEDQSFADEEVMVVFIDSFAPETLTVFRLLSLIKRVSKTKEIRSRDIKYYLIQYSEEICPQDVLLDWVKGLRQLLRCKPVVERRCCEISEKYKWLLSVARTAVERMVEDREPDVFSDAVLDVLSLTQLDTHYRTATDKLKQLVPEWRALNYAAFWHEVLLQRIYLQNTRNEKLTNWWQVRWLNDDCWSFGIEDFEVVLEWISGRQEVDDQRVALSLAFSLYRDAGRGRKRRERMKKAVAGNVPLEEDLKNYLHPAPMSEETHRLNRQSAYHRRRLKLDEAGQKESKIKWTEWLSANTQILRDTEKAHEGCVYNATAHLLEDIPENKDGGCKWAKWEWQALIPEYGLEIAEAFRDGCIDYWRKYQPDLRSEGIEKPNSVPFAVIIGLSGLEIESKQNLKWRNELSPDEVRLACRYSFLEMNGFPSWFEALHGQYPSIVEDALLRELEWELVEYKGKEPCHYILDNVIYHLEFAHANLSPSLLKILSHRVPKHERSLRQALQIILADPSLNTCTFAKLARAQAQKAAKQKAAAWFAAWMGIDADGAFPALKKKLQSIKTPSGGIDLVVHFVRDLIGSRRQEGLGAQQNYCRVPILLDLVKLTYQYVRTEDDLQRAGAGAYSPTARDDAQDARGKLVDLLREIPGKEAYAALIDLSQTHPAKELCDWYLSYAKSHAEAASESEPWRDCDVADFAQDIERAPGNHQELFDLSVSRLLDLKYDLEGGDSCIAPILVDVSDEKKHRTFIGGWLRDHAAGRYDAPQEEELADGKIPDIRVHGIGFYAPVPIELKVVNNNWSGAQLRERMENQLIGQYLRDQRSRLGIFLLVKIKDKQWVHPNTSERMDFSDLLKWLSREVKMLAETSLQFDDIKVIGFDLTSRTKPVKSNLSAVPNLGKNRKP